MSDIYRRQRRHPAPLEYRTCLLCCQEIKDKDDKFVVTFKLLEMITLECTDSAYGYLFYDLHHILRMSFAIILTHELVTLRYKY